MPDLIDPTQASKLELNRRAFVKVGAGAAAFGGAIAQALAAGEGFGKPHAPVVAESDPAITFARPKLPSAGRTIDSYVAVPKNAASNAPGIVICTHAWGVDAQIRDTARRFAKEGYVAIVPDIFSGTGIPSGDNTSDVAPFIEGVRKLHDDTIDADVAAGAGWLRARAPSAGSTKVGVTGFCMGGGITLRQTVDNAKAFQAAAMWYGKVRYGTTGNDGAITPIALAYADEVGVPLLGSFGARDKGILADDVRALDKVLRIPHDFKIYDEAGHGFFDDTRDSYVATAAADAWTRTLAWFAKYLRA